MFNKTTKIQLKQTQLFRFKILIKELDLLIQYIDQTRQGCLLGKWPSPYSISICMPTPNFTSPKIFNKLWNRQIKWICEVLAPTFYQSFSFRINNHIAVFRTAPAIPGLLNISLCIQVMFVEWFLKIQF